MKSPIFLFALMLVLFLTACDAHNVAPNAQQTPDTKAESAAS